MYLPVKMKRKSINQGKASSTCELNGTHGEIVEKVGLRKNDRNIDETTSDK